MFVGWTEENVCHPYATHFAMPANVIIFYSDKSHIITLPGKK